MIATINFTIKILLSSGILTLIYLVWSYLPYYFSLPWGAAMSIMFYLIWALEGPFYED